MPYKKFDQPGCIDLLIRDDSFYIMFKYISQLAAFPDFLATGLCEWKFNQPHGPHFE